MTSRKRALKKANGVYITQGRPLNQLDYQVAKTHKEIVRIMVFSTPYQKDGQATSNTKARAPLPGFSRVIWDEWGKKGVRMDTKALKKQMGAAIAMVLVAAVALGSATFAWFVTNNKVDATTSTISAQSNAAYMYIRNINNSDTNATSDVADITDNKELYPATWANHFDSTNNLSADAGIYQFETATAKDPKKSDIDESTRRVVGAPDSTEVLDKYAVKNTFKVGTKGTKLTNLIVDTDPNNGGISLVSGDNSNTQFDNALRILVKCGDNWVLCDKDHVIKSSNNNLLKDEIQPGDTNEAEVDIYVFYDGDDEAIYTNNLGSLKDASKKIKVTFTATADNK